MTHYTTLQSTIIVVGIVLLVAPALFPVQSVLYHDTRPGTMANQSMLEDDGFTIIAYEDLSPRAQEYYVETLRNDGQFIVPQDKPAQEFPYPTASELLEQENHWSQMIAESVIIERPENATLPPSDEPIDQVEYRFDDTRPREEERGTRTELTREEMRDQVARYDQMSTRTGLPPVFAPQSLLRLLSLVFGISAVAVGGYLWSKP